MDDVVRPIAFVLAPCDNGLLIVNRNDGKADFPSLGQHVLNTGGVDLGDIEMLKTLLGAKSRLLERSVLAVDVGANIGSHLIALANHMKGWGTIVGFEPQEFCYYALCGGIVLNNCFNARAIHAAVSDVVGSIMVPRFDFTKPGVFSGLHLLPTSFEQNCKDVGQQLDYRREAVDVVRMTTIDEQFVDAPFLDLLKIDVEGMDAVVLKGARQTIIKHRPMIFVETLFNVDEILDLLSSYGYWHLTMGANAIALHMTDPIRSQVDFVEGKKAA